MNKFFATVFSGALTLPTLATAADPERSSLLVGVAPGPYGDLFNKAVKPSLEKQGYKVEVKEFSDYVQPNLALAGKDIDLNVYQHSVYLKKFSQDKGLELSGVVSIPTAGLGLFSSKLKSVDQIPDGASVTIANDPTNLARALRFLAKLGLITIRPDIDPAKASERDIATNPKHLKVTPVEAAQVPRTLDGVDFAVVNGNYAIAAGLKLADALALEKLDENYKIVVAVRSEDLNRQFVKDVKAAIESAEFRDAVENPKDNFKDFQKGQWYLDKWGLAK